MQLDKKLTYIDVVYKSIHEYGNESKSNANPCSHGIKNGE
jgi:hypothetical protein